ncbi:50S ribosomal protein L4 [bacterium]|jgi:large subunit ribosomal protein L4|nr:50S ribosomal protein L4 [bacterium]
MGKIDVLSVKGKKVGDFSIPEKIEGFKYAGQLVHDAVVKQLAGRRSGNACTKTRAEVNRSGIKLYKQKGTGRARAGTAGSPTRVGGGVAFGPRPRDYFLRLNKKEQQKALKSAIAERFKTGGVIIVDKISIPAPKTKEIKVFLDNINAGENALIVLKELNNEFKMAVRNMPKVTAVVANSLNTYDVLYYKKLIIDKDAVKEIEEKFN